MTRIVSAGRVAHTRPSRRTWTPGEAAASGRKNPELFTTGVSVQFNFGGWRASHLISSSRL
jgi:hypothetical protein